MFYPSLPKRRVATRTLYAIALGAAVASITVHTARGISEERASATPDLSSLTMEELKAQLEAEAKKSEDEQDDEVMQRLMLEAIARGGSKPIYGPDNRTDWWDIADPKVKRRAAASVALFAAASLAPQAGRLKLAASSLGQRLGLCTNERFANQLSGAECSGVLVAPDLVVTAGHCVGEIAGRANASMLSDIRFIFGYITLDENDPGQSEFDPDRVFSGKRVVDGKLLGATDGSDDWAVIQLDRAVPKELAQPVKIAREGRIADDQRLDVIGYPSGLPLKYAPGAEIRRNDERAYFVANLDTFGGNSGSGVFASNTNELVGILVRGDTDYYRDRDHSCKRPFFCPSTGCDGEEVTRIEVVDLPPGVPGESGD